jgi:predicted transcriptional regulator
MYSSASTLESIEFLARSLHRVEVLDGIRTEPRTRDELRELTDASRVTLGRILTDFEERDWIVRTGRRYEATPRGAFIVAEFTRLVSNLDTAEELPELLEWLPAGEAGFDARLLHDATVTTASEGDLIASVRRAVEIISRSKRMWVVADGITYEIAEAIRDAVDDGLELEWVIGPNTAMAMRADDKLRRSCEDMLDSGQVTLYLYDAEERMPVFMICDETITLCTDDHQAFIETEDEAIHAWAKPRFESYLADSTPLTKELFTAEETPITSQSFTE